MLTISCRTQAAGGGVAPSAHCKDDLAPTARLRIFIHGHNVDETRARIQADQFFALLNSIGDSARITPAVYLWPSDRSSHRLFSRFRIAGAIEHARLAGLRLGEFLIDAGVEAELVAHSLGAFVALRALIPRETMSSRKARIVSITHLGPALTVAELTQEEFKYYRADVEGVMYHADDKVLRYVFGVGHRISRPAAYVGEIVGLTGNPAHRFKFRSPSEDNSHQHYRFRGAAALAIAVSPHSQHRSPDSRYIQGRTVDVLTPKSRTTAEIGITRRVW